MNGCTGRADCYYRGRGDLDYWAEVTLIPGQGDIKLQGRAWVWAEDVGADVGWLGGTRNCVNHYRPKAKQNNC